MISFLWIIAGPIFYLKTITICLYYSEGISDHPNVNQPKLNRRKKLKLGQ